MANWLKPVLTDLYTNVLDWLKARDTDLAKGLDPAAVTVENPQSGFIRWSSANRRWERFDGTSWPVLASSYAINADTASKWQSPRTITLSGGVTGSVSLDGSANVTLSAAVTQGPGSGLNADLLDGQHGAWYADILARLGFTPVRQGSGVGQTSNVVHIGWSAASKLKATVDSTDFGALAFEGWTASYVASAIASKAESSGTYSGLNVGYATSAGNADTVDGWHRDDIRAWGNLTGKPAGADLNFYFSYRSGSPQYVWGSTDSDGGHSYVYAAGNLSVGYAAIAGYATSASTAGTVSSVSTAQVLNATAGASAGAVGTYIFGTINGTAIYIGGVYSGSSIIPSGVYATGALPLNSAASGTQSALVTGGSYLAGSWLAMGDLGVSPASTYARATLFLRIA